MPEHPTSPWPSYDDWLAETFRPVAEQDCTGCVRPGGRFSDGANIYCEPCVRYQYGVDQAQAQALAAVVWHLIDAGNGREFVEGVVARTFAAWEAEEARLEAEAMA